MTYPIDFVNPPAYIPESLYENLNGDFVKIFVDLEHSGYTDGMNSICQISAISPSAGGFDKYILTAITPYMQKLTGLRAIGNTLVYNGAPVSTVSLHTEGTFY